MRKLLLLWLLLGVYGIGFTQIITITDGASHQPIELATLSSESPMANALTNSKGQADITKFKEACRV
jgi:hypothetical protein